MKKIFSILIIVLTAINVNANTLVENRIACDGGDTTECNNLGILYAKGQGVRQSYAKAKEYYGKACDDGNDDGCQNYAVLNKRKQ